MLFSLCQNKREEKGADEQLRGYAVDSCWRLCNIFREGCLQVRSESGNPRPSQTTFAQPSNQTSCPLRGDLPSLTESQYVPDTPTTEFEDNPISPDDYSPEIPNILVLSTEGNQSARNRWTSTTSKLPFPY
jgi:hypothetical protein